MKETLLRILVPAATVSVLGINYLAAMGFVNQRTPKEISDTYATILTPASYAFTIWSLIYLGMIGFSVYQLLPSQKDDPALKKTRPLYLLLSVFNIGWIFAWHYDFMPLSLLIMAILLVLLDRINGVIKSLNTNASLLLVRFPFGLYFGWITVALVLNAAIVAAYFKISFSDGTETAIAAIIVAAVAIIGSIVRFKIDSMAYPVAIAWGLTAIAINQSGNGILVLTCAFAMMTLLFFAFWGYVKDR